MNIFIYYILYIIIQLHISLTFSLKNNIVDINGKSVKIIFDDEYVNPTLLKSKICNMTILCDNDKTRFLKYQLT